MNTDRFQPPTAADELATCASCGEQYHYTALNDDGLCSECLPDEPIALLDGGNAVVWIVLALLFALPCSAQVVTEKFLDAVAMVESSGRLNAVGDSGKALGQFQLHRAAWEDASKIDPLLGDYKTGALDREKSRRAARIYFNILSARLGSRNIPKTPQMLYAAYNVGFGGLSKRGFNLSKCHATTKTAIKKLESYL